MITSWNLHIVFNWLITCRENKTKIQLNCLLHGLLRVCHLFFMLAKQKSVSYHGGRKHWAVYYTSPKRFLIRWLNSFGDFYWLLIGGFIKLSVQTFQPLIVIYKSCNLYIIIGNVHQFIGHSLIPLDPCLHTFVFIS